jgi:uncharacterized protein (DUF362 family)
MALFDEDQSRRQFIKNLTVGSMALFVGCSKESTAPDSNDNNDPPPDPLPKTQIALIKTADRTQGVHAVLEMLEFPSMSGKHVVLKPNFNTADPPPASTHNDTLRQLILEIQDRQASAVTLAERCYEAYQSFEDVIQLKGIDDMANELGFNIKHLGTDEYTVFNDSRLHWQNGFRLPLTIDDAECIVSTCCLKTHHTGVITMSLKLSVGILPFLHMNELHGSNRINSMIAEINLAYKPDLIVMDGVKTFISGGPSHGTVRDGNVILAGTDRIAMDVAGTAILKELGSARVSGQIFDLEQIRRAKELQLGIEGPDQIEFITADEESRNYAEQITTIMANG